MARSVFYFWMISFCFFLFLPTVLAKNRAASWLAEKIYFEACAEFQNKQWTRALQKLELAAELDPTFQTAQQKKTEWQTRLQVFAQKKYQAGERAFQNKQWAEAQTLWREASQALVRIPSPLVGEGQGEGEKLGAKIEQGLRLMEQNLNFVPASLPKPTPYDLSLTQKMSEVQEFLAAGESEKARLALAEVVYQHPQNDRAQKLLENLSQQGVTPTDEKTEKIYSQAETLFVQGKKTEGQGISAYPFYAEAFNLLNVEPFKPYFFAELSQRKENLENRIREIMKPKLEKWQTALSQKQINLKNLGQQLRKIVQAYPFFNEAKELLAAVYSALDEKAWVVLNQAKALQGLEGCSISVGKFEKAKEIAAFPEVPAWQEANKNIQACGESGKQRVENGKQRVENGKWKTENR